MSRSLFAVVARQKLPGNRYALLERYRSQYRLKVDGLVWWDFGRGYPLLGHDTDKHIRKFLRTNHPIKAA